MKNRITLVVTREDIDRAIECKKHHGLPSRTCPVAQSLSRQLGLLTDDMNCATEDSIRIKNIEWIAIDQGRNRRFTRGFDNREPVKPTRFTYRRVS